MWFVWLILVQMFENEKKSGGLVGPVFTIGTSGRPLHFQTDPTPFKFALRTCN